MCSCGEQRHAISHQTRSRCASLWLHGACHEVSTSQQRRFCSVTSNTPLGVCVPSASGSTHRKPRPQGADRQMFIRAPEPLVLEPLDRAHVERAIATVPPESSVDARITGN